MGSKDLAETAKDGNRWKAMETDLEGTLRPSDDVAMLTYEAKAVRANGEAYAALVSTGYVRRGGRWKLMFHQQTPIPTPSG